ncbi:phytanoyl-CoA dioxygenase family protein [Roseimicrobium sp. ORNL1]|uniref:phytanoyl-CoA dioxygenase family protein n=1 Tax=Roseimicrobium sp. ORNL1 TaxID=2711231 RepID=UPI0013E10ECA|nr:phytanoyl-CoA dioxygenase family protein [Roseimicrobium sp. ORNL1]QIF03413.1 phytanoyl-CoA dioxygenase family protein [Roseimicrobium sp. ORNL1]
MPATNLPSLSKFEVSPEECVKHQGFYLAPSVLTPSECAELVAYLGPTSGPGRRALLKDDHVASLARSEKLLALVSPHLQGKHAPRPVRAIYFNKSPDSNWLVAWHQDLTICVQKKVDVAGFGPWSVKDEVPHVQPPIALLENMITIRLHLDDTDETNGALKVTPGSHTADRLSPDAIQNWRQNTPEHLCTAHAGDALLMRPLLLHASGRSTSDRQRRVLHIEYAGYDLPAGMQWAEG